MLEITESCADQHSEVYNGLKRFCRTAVIGLLMEAIATAAAILVFVLTEDIYRPMTIRDNYTGLMVAIFAASLLVDYIFLRCRGKRPDQLIPDYPERTDLRPLPT